MGVEEAHLEEGAVVEQEEVEEMQEPQNLDQETQEAEAEGVEEYQIQLKGSHNLKGEMGPMELF
jgi:hypothetical protein